MKLSFVYQYHDKYIMANKTTKTNGKNKGNSFERKMANLLSARFEKFTGLKNSIRRNPDSGSFFGKTNQSRTETHSLDFAVFGDLIVPKNFNFSIECKHYKSPPSFQSVLHNDVTQWDKWLVQSNQDANSSGKKMLLIIKYNMVDEFVIVDEAIEGKKPDMLYKHYFIYNLDDFLLQDDNIFFTD